MAVYAHLSYGFRMLSQHHGFLVARKADFRLRQFQLQQRHVTLGLRLMADGTRDLHCRMDRLALGLVAVAGGTIVFLVKYAGVLNGVGLRHQGREQ